MPGADDGHAGLARPRFDQLAQQSTQMDEAPRLGQRRRDDIGIYWDVRQVRLWPRGDDRTGNAMVYPKLIAEGKVEAGIESRRPKAPRAL